jgi:hypothetical protein
MQGWNEFCPTLFVQSPGMADIGMVEWENRGWVTPKESQLKK